MSERQRNTVTGNFDQDIEKNQQKSSIGNDRGLFSPYKNPLFEKNKDARDDSAKET